MKSNFYVYALVAALILAGSLVSWRQASAWVTPLAVETIKTEQPKGKLPPHDSRSQFFADAGRPRNGLIAFSASAAGGEQLFSLDARSGDRRQLTTEGSANKFPAWSSDGATIVFSSNRTGTFELWTMRADGGAQTQIQTELPGEKFVPQLSPEGTTIVFAYNDPVIGHPEVWSISTSGGNARKLTTTPKAATGPTWSLLPHFSPDGRRIAYASTRSGSSQIWLMNADGSGQTQLTSGLGAEFPDANAPQWSPDGSKIVFWSGFETKHGEIWIMRADGTDARQLTDQPGIMSSDNPIWSPDGTKILFDTNRQRSIQIWMMNADGSDQHLLVDIGIGNTRFSWQPLQQNAPNSALAFSLGNLSVPFLLKEWGSPLIAKGVDPSQAAHERELAAILKDASDLGAQSIEDYLGWAVVESESGRWDWSAYQQDARAIAGRGLRYVPFVWIQNLPRWVRSDPSYPRARCVEHGLECEALSVFSPKTMQLYDRFFARMASDFGERIDLLRIGAPNDFGETTYPVGAATFAFPDRHIHPGFWVDEADARAHFAAAMRAKYVAVAALNRAWGTQFASFDRLDYPPDASRRRWWLDFVNWYHDAHTEKMGELLDVAAARFPSTPLNLNLGFPDERIAYGQDISGVVKAVSKRRQQLRTPTGSSVPFFYTKRVATAVRFYGLAGFSSEPQDGEAPAEAIASAAFKDLTTDVTLHFDYPPNMVRGKDSIEAERRLWRGKYPAGDTALFFSTTAHRLDDSQREQGFKGYPDRLAPFTEGLRDVVDYDVVDERLVGDGALASYRVLVWPFGFVTEAATLSRLRAWVEGGGVLVVGDLANVATVEGDRGAFAGLPTGNAFPLGRGAVFNANGSLDQLAFIVASRGYVQAGAIPSSALLPPLDRVADGVLVSEFDDGIMLFNTTSKEVTKNLAMPPGQWRLSYNGLPQQVVLPPLAIRWVDGRRERAVANVSAASYLSISLAPDSIVSAFGSSLASATLAAAATPLPTSLAGTTVKVKDSAGLERLAPLFFVSPMQINYQLPAGTATGAAVITSTGSDGSVSVGSARIAAVAPGLFTANANGQGVAAASALRVKADGAQQVEAVARFDAAQQQFVAVPLDLGPETDQVFLLLFGTGLRYRSSLSGVSARVGGADAQVVFAGAQGDFVGLDQVNVRLSRSLTGRGEVEVALMVDGQAANTVRVGIK